MGPGLKQEVIDRLYEAFFSTKPEGNLGIGFVAVPLDRRVQGGRIRAQNLYSGTTAVGCRFSFTLPVGVVHSEGPTPPP